MLPRASRTLVARTASGHPLQHWAATSRASRHFKRNCPSQSSKRSSIRFSAFSTMSSLKGAATTPAGNRDYDPEIKDIASYVHNYKIDSDLAVRQFLPFVINAKAV